EEQKQRVEHRKSKKYHYVDGDENGGRFADRIEQLKKNSFKEKLAKERLEQSRQRERDFIRQKQSAIFLQHNKDNTAFLPNREKLKGFIAKKGKFLLFAGAGLAAVVPILAIIIVIAVIASFFGWLLPMDYSLAGDDEIISVETTAEVIDGYCKLIKDYMDVTQAYYYFTYGDWYGGTYNYPAAAGDYSSFYSNFCKKKADEIRSIYEPYIDAAPDPAEKNRRINEMNKAISDAMKNADKEAKAEFEKMLSEVDDTLTAAESRQPYEVSRNDGANGISDSTEFTDKPIVGTNFFGNTEIQSDISAEELLSYIALYKTLETFDTAKSEEDDSEEESMAKISLKDISEFFKETGYIPITVEITHDNSCDGKCKRRMITGSEGGIEWEYYCDGDHDDLYGEIGKCISEDELLAKIIELTEPEKYGMDEDSCKKMIGGYLELIKKELDISEDDFRKFGAADNEKAKEFYDMLTDEGDIPNNFWDVYLPMDGESEGDDE
ncbi:MAG: hypothetical protein K6C13_13045, partial [Oscillospiraceae bacterium]|nr:hypothetical protein [Oscillospiraceae bacterium]